jgi:radical SAM/Cys-rich protein
MVINSFDTALQSHNLQLRRVHTRILQINVGKKCNQTCAHCHVNAGPARTEVMTHETIYRVLDWLAQTDIGVVDITGGAPELNPHFRTLVRGVRELSTATVPRRVMDRCNLTVIFEPGQEDLTEFLAEHEVEVVASLPCYSLDNVEKQRGQGVFDKSIAALQKLNSLGYGIAEKLPLHLVYNPVGAFLPGAQSDLEAAYKHQLQQHFGITFNNLYALANMPIARFANWLRLTKQWDEYSQLLLNAFNPHAVGGLMCRDTINVGWQGEVYDCDFNAMLGMQWRNGKPCFCGTLTRKT